MVKKIILVMFLLAPFHRTMAQEEVKVLQMTVVRSNGQEISASLSDSDSFVGPVLKIKEQRLVITGRSLAFNRIREIRFDVKTEIVDKIEVQKPESKDIKKASVYSLDGRWVCKEEAFEKLPDGIYIRNGKKYRLKSK